MHTRISHHQNKCTRQITRLSFLGLILLRANLCIQQSVFVGGVSTQPEIEFLKSGEIKTTTQCILDQYSPHQLCFPVSAPKAVRAKALRGLLQNGNPQRHSLERDHSRVPAPGLPSAENLPFPRQLEHRLLYYSDYLHLYSSFPGGAGFPL